MIRFLVCFSSFFCLDVQMRMNVTAIAVMSMLSVRMSSVAFSASARKALSATVTGVSRSVCTKIDSDLIALPCEQQHM